jgi:hypothetical protein
MALHLSHLPPLPCEPPSVVSPTTAQKMIALTTTATPSVMQNTTVTKRPKLSLQTASLPATFGNSNTGLARTCITASPTVRNTFSNAYEIKHVLSAIESPSPCRSAGGARYGSPFLSHRSDPMPYQLPLGVRSILRNSPLKKMALSRRSVSISAGAISENRRVYFPARKQVSFRNHLEEEIKTVRFVARHSDIESESEYESSESDGEGDSGSDSGGSQSEGHSSSGEDDEETQGRSVLKKKRKSVSSERQIRAAALRDGFDDDQIAMALTAGPPGSRRKRRCKWRWTLGNLASNELESKTKTTPSTKSSLLSQLAQETQPTQAIDSNKTPTNKAYDVS